MQPLTDDEKERLERICEELEFLRMSGYRLFTHEADKEFLVCIIERLLGISEVTDG